MGNFGVVANQHRRSEPWAPETISFFLLCCQEAVVSARERHPDGCCAIVAGRKGAVASTFSVQPVRYIKAEDNAATNCHWAAISTSRAEKMARDLARDLVWVLARKERV